MEARSDNIKNRVHLYYFSSAVFNIFIKCMGDAVRQLTTANIMQSEVPGLRLILYSF